MLLTYTKNASTAKFTADYNLAYDRAMTNPVYLDHAAATPVDDAVLAVMQPYFSQSFYNPSAIYLAAKSVSHDIADARAAVARTLGVRPAEITFTAGGTEANNLAIHGVMTNFPGSHMVVSAVEHDSVLESAKEYSHSIAPALSDGRVDIEQLRALITDATVLVSIMYVNNEVGTVMSLSRIAKMLDEVRSKRLAAGNSLPIYLHSDAAQAPLFFDLHVKHLGVDMLTLNGGKMYGPKQSGLLYADANIRINAL
jgi:cysteine desulfurase